MRLSINFGLLGLTGLPSGQDRDDRSRNRAEHTAGAPASGLLEWTMPTKDQVTEALRAVIDPELRRDIVELEMVRSIDIHANGVVDVMVSLTTAGCPIRSHFQTGVAEAVRGVEGVTGVNISFDVLSDNEKQGLGHKLGRGRLPQGALAQVTT